VIKLVDVCIAMFKPIFQAIVHWLEAIYSKIGATDIVLVAVTISLVAALLIRPIRGSSYSTSFLSDFSSSKVNNVRPPKRKEVRGSGFVMYED